MRGLKKNFNSTNFRKLSIHYFKIYRYLYDLLYSINIVSAMNIFGNLSVFTVFFRNSKPGVFTAAGGDFIAPAPSSIPIRPPKIRRLIAPPPSNQFQEPGYADPPVPAKAAAGDLDSTSCPPLTAAEHPVLSTGPAPMKRLRNIRFLRRACPHETLAERPGRAMTPNAGNCARGGSHDHLLHRPRGRPGCMRNGRYGNEPRFRVNSA